MRLSKLNTSYRHHIIKQKHTVEYLWCYLDSTLSGESMVRKVFLKKVNAKIKFLYRQNSQINV